MNHWRLRSVLIACLLSLHMVGHSAEGEAAVPNALDAQMPLLADLAREAIYATIEERPPQFPSPLPSVLESAPRGVQVVLFSEGQLLADASSYRDDTPMIGNLRLACGKAALAVEGNLPDEFQVVLCLFGSPTPVPPNTIIPFYPGNLGESGYTATYKSQSAWLPPLTPVIEQLGWKEYLLRLSTEVNSTRNGSPLTTAEIIEQTGRRTFQLQSLSSIQLASLATTARPVPLIRMRPLVLCKDVNDKRLATACTGSCSWLMETASATQWHMPAAIDTRAPQDAAPAPLYTQVHALWAIATYAMQNEDAEARTFASEATRDLMELYYLEQPTIDGGHLAVDTIPDIEASINLLETLLVLSEKTDSHPAIGQLARWIQSVRTPSGWINPDLSDYYRPEDNLRLMARCHSSLLRYAAATGDTEMTKALQEQWSRAIDQVSFDKHALLVAGPAWIETTCAMYRATRITRFWEAATRWMSLLIFECAQPPRPDAPDMTGQLMIGKNKQYTEAPLLYTARAACALAAVNSLIHDFSLTPSEESLSAEELQTHFHEAVRYLLQSQLQAPTTLIWSTPAASAKGLFTHTLLSRLAHLDEQPPALLALLGAAEALKTQE